MITGIVTASREAVIRLKARGVNGQDIDFRAILDTGFTGFLTLPPALISSLGLTRIGDQSVILGDGSVQLVSVYSGIVEWDGQDRLAEIDAADTDPLIGMSLLYGFKMTMETVDGGSVLIERL
ncbi:MAG: clan AA aspartic protease [bacterium]|jgi:hypothetical protein